MTETIVDNPNFDVYINGTLVIKKVLPVDDRKMFFCIAWERLIGRKRSTTILNIPKVMFIKVIYNYDNNV